MASSEFSCLKRCITHCCSFWKLETSIGQTRTFPNDSYSRPEEVEGLYFVMKGWGLFIILSNSLHIPVHSCAFLIPNVSLNQLYFWTSVSLLSPPNELLKLLLWWPTIFLCISCSSWFRKTKVVVVSDLKLLLLTRKNLPWLMDDTLMCTRMVPASTMDKKVLELESEFGLAIIISCA